MIKARQDLVFSACFFRGMGFAFHVLADLQELKSGLPLTLQKSAKAGSSHSSQLSRLALRGLILIFGIAMQPSTYLKLALVGIT